MANFIYDPKQENSVNLDNVDLITVGEGSNGGFKIFFEKLVVLRERNYCSSFADWIYDTEAERDSAYRLIMKAHGKSIGHENNPLAV